jgi:hypothetical protein
MWQLAGRHAVLREAFLGVPRLVRLRAEPQDVAVLEDDVEQHQPLDHPAAMRPLSVAVVGLSNQAVEAFVVEVIEPPLMQMARGLHAANPR